MEKRRPTYDLASIKVEFATVAALRMTRSARDAAFALGFNLQEVVDVIESISAAHFFKSMTSYANVRIWQDVYHVPCGGLVLYVKFTVDEEGKLVIAFKEK